MAKLGISSRLNSVSKKMEIDTTGYRSVLLDPDELTPSQENFYSQDNIEELADNMKMVGHLQPILVARVDGEYRVISGHRRRAAVLMNKERGIKGFDKIECLMKDMSENMFMLTLLSANMFNRKLTDWEIIEQARQFKEYLKKASLEDGIVIEGKMRDYIADAMGVSSTKMAQIEKINNSLCDEGKEALKNGEINFTIAYETSKLDPEEQREVISNKHLLSKDVKELVEQKKNKEQEQQEEDYTIPDQTTIDDYVEFEPQPNTVQSICYDCTHWNECDQKGNTVLTCNEHVSKSEAYKSEEQRYNEQQDKIDKQTAKALQEREDERKLDEKLNSGPRERQVHVLRESTTKWNDYISGDLTFIPIKYSKNEQYMKGDRIELQEYAGGIDRGRRIIAEITYVMFSQLYFNEDYFVVGIKVIGGR